ncbi:AraC family transcriptional regulator [Cohnella herbarum]|uniref:AraC family transcriptional regulator n=1 Tax=Cohnella herbarum TaxID=2728023 RepID=A0A7Z2ZKS1_9BACL|nr:AraC family transcriptional regulator [Cohnella herbarum]QJD83135.1 AraC family transcriptional regulator [Cohnella herbarum]
MNRTHNKPVSLHYSETREIGIAGGAKHTISPSPYDRFGICFHSDVLVSVEDTGRPSIEVPLGELFYIPEGLSFALQPLSSSDAKVNLISFRVDSSQRRSGLLSPYVLRSFRVPQLKNWISEFTNDNENEVGALSDYFLLQSRLYAIAFACMKSEIKPTRKGDELTRFVEQARQRIVENYDTALDMEELARNSGSGSSRFYRTFRKQTGLSPLKYLITTRLNASLRLLADSNVSVTEAAHSVGYSDEYYFSRLFKKQLGITPTEYASRAQVSVACLSPIFSGDLAVLGLTPRVTLKRDWELEDANLADYLEEIKSAQPDLILSGPISEPLRIELSKIAPVSVYYWHDYSWKQRLVEFGRLLGLESVAERWLADFESKTDNARQHVVERWPDTPYLLIGVRETNFRVYGKQRRKFTDLLYDELQLKAPAIADEIGFMDSAVLGELTKLPADNVMFLIEFSASESYCEQLEKEWKSAVGANGHERQCIFIRLENPFLYNSAMHELLVDQIVNNLHTQYRLK